MTRFRLPALCAAATMLVACGQNEPIRLGFIGGLSGRFAELGEPGRNGALFAVEQRNAAGGIDGRSIELVVRDDGQDPARAIAAFDELMSARAVAVIGPMTSTMAVVLAPHANARKRVLMGGTVVTTRLSALDDYFLRAISTSREYARHQARYHATRLSLRRAVMFVDTANADYTETWAQDYREQFEALDGDVLKIVRYDSRSTADIDQLARAPAIARADAAVMVTSPSDAAMLARVLRRAGLTLQLSGAGWTASTRLIDLGDQAVDGMIVEQYYDRADPSPAFADFTARYEKRFGDKPGYAALTAYDAANVILDALETTRDPGKLKDAILARGQFNALQGPLRFDRFGDAQRPLYLTEVRDGRFMPLAP